MNLEAEKTLGNLLKISKLAELIDTLSDEIKTSNLCKINNSYDYFLADDEKRLNYDFKSLMSAHEKINVHIYNLSKLIYNMNLWDKNLFYYSQDARLTKKEKVIDNLHFVIRKKLLDNISIKKIIDKYITEFLNKEFMEADNLYNIKEYLVNKIL